MVVVELHGEVREIQEIFAYESTSSKDLLKSSMYFWLDCKKLTIFSLDANFQGLKSIFKY